ncbi:MAG: hypothetical protein ACRERE_29350 [Candidatus Entotheonellia bacterium]
MCVNLPQRHTVAPGAQIVVLTGGRDAEVHRRSIQLGAMGLVLKEERTAVLIQAIAQVSAGEIGLNNRCSSAAPCPLSGHI